MTMITKTTIITKTEILPCFVWIHS